MKERTTTINDGHYGFGGIFAGIPEPVEKPRPDPEDDRIDQDDLLKAQGWTLNDLDEARSFGFPEGKNRYHRDGRRTTFYSRTQANEWRDRLVRFAGRVKAIR